MVEVSTVGGWLIELYKHIRGEFESMTSLKTL